VVNEAGKPIANAVIHVRNDTNGRDIDHDVTSGELAEYYCYASVITATVTCTFYAVCD